MLHTFVVPVVCFSPGGKFKSPTTRNCNKPSKFPLTNSNSPYNLARPLGNEFGVDGSINPFLPRDVVGPSTRSGMQCCFQTTRCPRRSIKYTLHICTSLPCWPRGWIPIQALRQGRRTQPHYRWLHQYQYVRMVVINAREVNAMLGIHLDSICSCHSGKNYTTR